MATEKISILVDQGRAMLNNIKYNKNDNNIKTLNDITSSDYQKADVLRTSLESTSSNQSISSQKALGVMSAAPWGYLKLDLFDNANDQQLINNQRRLHAKLSIKKHNNPSWLYASAGLNARMRDAKRGLNFGEPKDLAHWTTMQEVYQHMKQEYQTVYISKFYKAGNQKGKTIKGLSLVVGQVDQLSRYDAVIIKGTDIYMINLDNFKLSDSQRKKNVIASGEWKDGQASSNELTVDDFLGE